jgi:isocitrate dehydrogenase (NAD+)
MAAATMSATQTRRTVTLINGDGIGPEVMEATRKVLEAAKAPLDFEYQDAGNEVSTRYGTNLPDATVQSVLKNGVGLKGPTATGIGVGENSANVGLRKRLDLYVSLRPVKSVPNVKTRYEDVDLVVVRENTEDLYAGLEHIVVPGVAQSLKIITEKASTRICRYAFEYATRMKRKKVSAVHKANIMKLSDGLFLDCFRRASRDFPQIQAEEVIVDALCMQLVKDPTRFDVMVMENLYGDIVSDLCAGLVGGLGLVPGANIGSDSAVFEAVHGTAPDIAGKGLANPTALLMSSVMMLDWMGHDAEARRVEKAVFKVYADGKVRTGDLGGKSTTAELTQAIIGALG